MDGLDATDRFAPRHIGPSPGERDRMLQAVDAVGLEMPGMHVVITPNRPVACAEPGVARRLAGETAEACVIAPWQALVDLPWVF